MREAFYLTDYEAVLNFDLAYPETKSDMIRSKEFQAVLAQFIGHLRDSDHELYGWAVRDGSESEAIERLCVLARMLVVFDLDELGEEQLETLGDRALALEFVEQMYNYWRRLDRFAVTRSRISEGVSTTFIEADSSYGNLVIETFRRIEQTLMGRPNKVFRQQNAGTNAIISCYRNQDFRLSDHYKKLKEVWFIESVMMHTPMILRPRSNKREWAFEEVQEDPVVDFTVDPADLFCYPAKVGTLLVFIYFHKDFMANGISCANLFEMATPEEVQRKPDCIVLFGNPDGRSQCRFYHDEDENIWIGSVSHNQKVEYFGYMKKMVLTLHNVAMMQRKYLPIHGAFLNITLKDGKRKGICLMGDSGAGKSETIEALKSLGDDKIKRIEIVFDDMGSFHIEEGTVYAEGTETGAFVRLDDLDPGTPYRDINRSIFFNPDESNARIITPAAPYEIVAAPHRIDLFAYANNYDDGRGLREVEDLEEAKEIFIRGRRMAKGTTQEVGLSETYFANPFGPQQKQDVCQPIIDEVFRTLRANGTLIGEVYTHLGRDPEDREGIRDAARDLLKFIEEQ